MDGEKPVAIGFTLSESDLNALRVAARRAGVPINSNAVLARWSCYQTIRIYNGPLRAAAQTAGLPDAGIEATASDAEGREE